MVWLLIILGVVAGLYLLVGAGMLVSMLAIGFALRIPLTEVLRETLGECLLWPWVIFR